MQRKRLSIKEYNYMEIWNHKSLELKKVYMPNMQVIIKRVLQEYRTALYIVMMRISQ